MGNSQKKNNNDLHRTQEQFDREPSQPDDKKNKSKSKGCFGARNDINTTKSRSDQINRTNREGSSYYHDTKKSSIKVNNMPNAKIDEKLFTDRQNKVRLDIKMKRSEPY